MKPAGFSKAGPEKPRSVSHWPGLAGLKACRLSAGRPGRLRTLTERRVGNVGEWLVIGTIMLDHKIGGMLDHDLIEENL